MPTLSVVLSALYYKIAFFDTRITTTVPHGLQLILAHQNLKPVGSFRACYKCKQAPEAAEEM